MRRIDANLPDGSCTGLAGGPTTGLTPRSGIQVSEEVGASLALSRRERRFDSARDRTRGCGVSGLTPRAFNADDAGSSPVTPFFSARGRPRRRITLSAYGLVPATPYNGWDRGGNPERAVSLIPGLTARHRPLKPADRGSSPRGSTYGGGSSTRCSGCRRKGSLAAAAKASSGENRSTSTT